MFLIAKKPIKPKIVDAINLVCMYMSLSRSFTGVRECESLKKPFSVQILPWIPQSMRDYREKSLKTVTHPFTLCSTQMLSRHNDRLDDYLNYFLDHRCTNILYQSPKAKYMKLFWKECRMHKSLQKRIQDMAQKQKCIILVSGLG